MELDRVENNTAVYKENGKTITVIREFSQNDESNFWAVIDTLIDIIEQEERGYGANEE